MEQTIFLDIQFSSIILPEAEILAEIGEEKMRKIKAMDPKPKFVVYAVGQEGKSNPNILAGDNKPVMWMKEKISQLAKSIKAGTKLFFGHNKDNSTEGRESYGEVVASFERMIAGKNTALIVAYVPAEKREFVAKQDIISMEAVIELVDQGMQYLADGIKKVTGLAIGSSENWKPAMPGAAQLSMIQAMSITTLEKPEVKMDEPKSGGETTFVGVEKFVKDRKVFVSQLYTPADVFGIPTKDDKGRIRFQGGDYKFREDAEKYVASIFDEKAQDIIEENKRLKEELDKTNQVKKEYFNKAVKSEWIPQLKQKAQEKKYTDKALKLLDLETQGLDIPEDEAEREKLGEKILQVVAEKHKALFDDVADTDKDKPLPKPGQNDEETF